MSSYLAGLDLGQAGDYTALTILEQVELPKGAPRIERVEHHAEMPWERGRMSEPGPMERSLLGLDDTTEYHALFGIGAPMPWPTIVEERTVQDSGGTEYHLRHLERAELGTSYVDIVAHVLARLDTPPLRGQTTLLVDRTGVGRGVFDLFARAQTAATVIPITITPGDTVSQETDGSGGYRVPKRDLVGCLQVLLQQQRLRIAEGLPLGRILAAELLNFKAKISASGHDSYAAGAASDWREGSHDDLVIGVTMPCWYAEYQVAAAPALWSPWDL